MGEDGERDLLQLIGNNKILVTIIKQKKLKQVCWAFSVIPGTVIVNRALWLLVVTD
jgi:hypothetical protein